MAISMKRFRIDPARPRHSSRGPGLYKKRVTDEHAFADPEMRRSASIRGSVFYNRRGLFYSREEQHALAVDDFNERSAPSTRSCRRLLEPRPSTFIRVLRRAHRRIQRSDSDSTPSREGILRHGGRM